MIPDADAVHLWRWRLDLSPTDLATAWAVLDGDERARADRFRSPLGRTRFVAARAGLRRRLGRLLEVSPDAVRFRYGPFGKPELDGGNVADLRFNLSHSGDLAVLAAASGFELGADVERLRPVEADRLADRTFSAAEAARIGALPVADKQAGFFRCWTRKEAYVKALGRGFDLPLGSFAVSLAPGEPARLLRVDGEPDEPARWQLVHLEPEPGYVGAVAARRTGWRVVERE